MSQTNILLESGTNEFEIVEFFITETPADGTAYTGWYGVNVAKVLEIIRVPGVTAMPQNKHPCIMGTFNLRSRVVPLINLCSWLGRAMEPTQAGKVIVTEFNHVINSFLVSGVNRIHRLSWEQVEPPGEHLLQFSGGCITGVVKVEDRIIMLLDMESIVADLNPSLGPTIDEAAPPAPVSANDPVRILFADDSSMIRKTLTRGLEQAGFTVTAASDGTIAWNLLQEIRNTAQARGESILKQVNLVISDVEMPSMDGHNLTKRIKSDPVLKELPVILFSSLISDALRHKGESVGADDQIAKPDINSLTGRVRNLLTERQGLVFPSRESANN